MPPDVLTLDGFLGGQLRLWQPREGYRAGVDPVLLAAATPAKPGQSVLELGCGVGAASLCLAARVSDLSITGVELQPDYADLARRNAEENKVDFHVDTADLSNLPDDLRQQSFDHVIANPPYYLREKSTPARDQGRDLALGGDTPLSIWIDTAARRLKPKGYLSLIQRIDRLPEVVSLASKSLGSLEIYPISARQNRAAHLFILRARKGGRADFQLNAPIIMHEGIAHERDGDDYSPEISAILRNGAGFPFAD